MESNSILLNNRDLPLLNRSYARPGESLASLFERLAILNHHDSTYPLYQLCHERLTFNGIRDRQLWSPMCPETFGVIARLTGIEPPQLHEMTIHRFAPIITPPEQELRSITLSHSSERPVLSKMGSFKQLRTIHTSRYCPYCLRDKKYQHLVWNFVALSACTIHACILINRCPGCDNHLSVRSIVRATCLKCGADLIQVDPTSVNDDQLGMRTQHEIYSWVMNNKTAYRHFKVGDLDLSPRTRFRIIDGLVCALIGRNLGEFMHKIKGVPVSPMIRDAKAKRSLTPHELFALYATAMKALANWPRGFHELLDVYALNNPKVGPSGLHVEFGALYKNWISHRWKHQQFSFLQDEFIRYLESNGKLSRARGRANRYQSGAQLTDRFSSMAISQKEAAGILKISPSRVKALITQGHLRRYGAWKEDHGWNRLLVKDDVLQFAMEAKKLLNLSDSANALGVSKNYLRGMINHQILLPEDTPASSIRRGVMLSPETIAIFIDRLGDAASSVGMPTEKLVDLHYAARILTTIGVNSFQLLRMVLEGKFTCYLHEGHLSVKALRFDRAELEAHIESVRVEMGLITRNDVAERLAINLRKVSAMIEAGDLRVVTSFGSTLYFEQTSLEQL